MGSGDLVPSFMGLGKERLLAKEFNNDSLFLEIGLTMVFLPVYRGDYVWYRNILQGIPLWKIYFVRTCCLHLSLSLSLSVTLCLLSLADLSRQQSGICCFSIPPEMCNLWQEYGWGTLVSGRSLSETNWWWKLHFSTQVCCRAKRQFSWTHRSSNPKFEYIDRHIGHCEATHTFHSRWHMKTVWLGKQHHKEGTGRLTRSVFRMRMTEYFWDDHNYCEARFNVVHNCWRRGSIAVKD